MGFARACALLVIVGAAACGDSASSPAPKPATPFTVWVYEDRFFLDDTEQPIAGAPVAFDPADGGPRVTKTTEPDGRVTFEGDFSVAGASVTVLSPAHLFLTMFEASPENARARGNTVGKPAEDLVLFAPRLDDIASGRTVALSGAIAGKKAPLNVVTVAASTVPRVGGFAALESSYRLRAPRDRPFFLFGTETKTLVDDADEVVFNELVKAFRIELPARSGDEILDLDLATLPALPSRKLVVRAEGSFPIARATASVASLDSLVRPGIFGQSTTSPDGKAADLEVTLVDTDVAPDRLVSRVVLTAADGSRSTRAELGIMADGTEWRDFPPPPALVLKGASQKVIDPIPLDGFPAGADFFAELIAGGTLFWIFEGPPGGPKGKSITIPYRGEVRNVDIQLFALSITARFDPVIVTPRGVVHRRSSSFRDIALTKR